MDESLHEVVAELRKYPVAFPTETVYGLGAPVWHPEVISEIFRIKNRPADNPLIVHVSSLDMVRACISGEIPEKYFILMHKYWPGPLTLLFRKSENIHDIVTAGGEYVAIRMPSHPKALQLISSIGIPLVAPSANKSTRPSPTSAAHVLADLNGCISYIVDGGVCEYGVESTVISCVHSPPLFLRAGGVSYEDLRKEIPDMVRTVGAEEKKMSPGTRYKHYSPTADVVFFIGAPGEQTEKLKAALKVKKEGKKAAILAPESVLSEIGIEAKKNGIRTYSLGTTPKEAAKNLFAGLRYLDLFADVIYAVGPTSEKEGAAVIDRLTKAATEIR